ncbi:unnamed protein product, partial [Schistosoma turkestanicum]
AEASTVCVPCEWCSTTTSCSNGADVFVSIWMLHGCTFHNKTLCEDPATITSEELIHQTESSIIQQPQKPRSYLYLIILVPCAVLILCTGTVYFVRRFLLKKS